MKLSIALVQFSIAPSNPTLNIRRMEELIGESVKKGAQLVVFPEDSVSGPLSGQVNFIDQSANYLAEFQRLAFKFQVDLVPGTWTTQVGPNRYNTAHYITKDGLVAGSYNKINLWKNELAIVSPGVQVAVFPTAYGLVGLTICWDISFPLLYSEMAKRGAKLIISPSYWSFTLKANQIGKAAEEEIQLIDSLCITRAFENNIAFAYCNAAGELKSEGVHAVLSGRSQVTHATQKVLCKSEGNDEEILYANLDFI